MVHMPTTSAILPKYLHTTKTNKNDGFLKTTAKTAAVVLVPLTAIIDMLIAVKNWMFPAKRTFAQKFIKEPAAYLADKARDGANLAWSNKVPLMSAAAVAGAYYAGTRYFEVAPIATGASYATSAAKTSWDYTGGAVYNKASNWWNSAPAATPAPEAKTAPAPAPEAKPAPAPAPEAKPAEATVNTKEQASAKA